MDFSPHLLPNAAIDEFLARDFLSQYARAYSANPALQDLVPEALLERHSSDVIGALESFPEISELITNSSPLESQRIFQAIILLYGRADQQKRKFTSDPIYLHALEITNEFLNVSKQIAETCGLTLEEVYGKDIHDEVIALLLHDLIEDCKTTKEQIVRIFNKRIADKVAIMTIPEEPDLLMMYEEVTREITKRARLPQAKVDQVYHGELAPQAFLDGLGLVQRTKLKGALKEVHKSKSAKLLSFALAVGKGIDSRAPLVEDERHIREGVLFVCTAPIMRRLRKTTRASKSFPLLYQKATSNYTSRCTYNEGIIAHIQELAISCEEAGYDPQKYLVAMRILRERFAVVDESYLETVEQSKKRTVRIQFCHGTVAIRPDTWSLRRAAQRRVAQNNIHELRNAA